MSKQEAGRRAPSFPQETERAAILRLRSVRRLEGRGREGPRAHALSGTQLRLRPAGKLRMRLKRRFPSGFVAPLPSSLESGNGSGLQGGRRGLCK